MAPGQPTITACQPQVTAQISHAIEYLGGTGAKEDRDGQLGGACAGILVDWPTSMRWPSGSRM